MVKAPHSDLILVFVAHSNEFQSDRFAIRNTKRAPGQQCVTYKLFGLITLQSLPSPRPGRQAKLVVSML